MIDDLSPAPHDAGEVSLMWIGGVMKAIGVSPCFEPTGSHIETQLKSYLNRERKEVSVNLMTEAWSIILKQKDLIKKLKDGKENLFEKTIELQDELLESQEKSLKSIGQIVTEAVSDTVSEIKSYSAAVSSNQGSPLSQKCLQKAVKTVIEEEDRAKNVICFGLEESEDEALEDKVGAVFQELGEKMKVEGSRIGKKKPGVTRPVKVKLRNGAAAIQILRKSSELKKSARFMRVFLCPDRSEEERDSQRQLVAELKKKIAEEPHQTHFIREGTIISRSRTVNDGG